MKTQKGFTLVEALVTVVFFSIIVGACFLLSKVGNESWQVNSVRVQLAQENRKSLDWLMNEMHQAGVSTIVGLPADGAWYTTVSFKIANGIADGVASLGDTITYTLVDHQLKRTQSGQERIIANNMTVFQLRRMADKPKIIEVALTFADRTARGSQQLDLSSNFKIKVRNE